MAIGSLNRTALFLARLLAGVGFLLCMYSSYEYVHLTFFSSDGSKAACNINDVLNCEAAIRSKYATLFGYSLGNWGALFYSFLLGFLFLSPALAQGESLDEDSSSEEYKSDRYQDLSIAFVLSLFSLGFSLYLLYITLTKLTAYCPVCIALYVVSLILPLTLMNTQPWKALGEQLVEGIKGMPLAPIRAIPFICFEVPQLLMSKAVVKVILIFFICGFGLLSDRLFYDRLLITHGSPESAVLSSEEVIDLWLSQKAEDALAFPKENDSFGPYQKGSGDAPVQIVEFFDFECPYCRFFSFEVEKIYEKHKDQVALQYRNYPLDHICNPSIEQPFHRNACQAALFTRCAGEQGLYWEAAEYIFTLKEIDDQKSAAAIRKAIWNGVEVLGLDPEAAKDCRNSDRQMKVIAQDITLADELKIQGTPTVYVNGRLVEDLKHLDMVIQYLIDNDSES